MLVLSGKSTKKMTAEELHGMSSSYSSVCVDIGTGDGKRLYRTAVKHPDTLYIGIDPVRENMLDTLKKTERKPAKGGIDNMLLVVGAVEALPEELAAIADEVTVFFPWGTLLECIIKPLNDPMCQIYEIAKNGAAFTFVTTYAPSFEAGEINKRQLPDINMDYLCGEYKDRLFSLGFEISDITLLSADDVRNIGTQWAKRLTSSRDRKFYSIKGIITKSN